MVSCHSGPHGSGQVRHDCEGVAQHRMPPSVALQTSQPQHLASLAGQHAPSVHSGHVNGQVPGLQSTLDALLQVPWIVKVSLGRNVPWSKNHKGIKNAKSLVPAGRWM